MVSHRHLLAFTTKEGVLTVTVTEHGPEQPFRVVQGWSSPAWSPNGKELAVLRQEPGDKKFTGTVAVGVVARTGGSPRVILKETYPRDTSCGPVGPLSDPAWSADGEWLAFYRRGLYASQSADCNELAVTPVKGGTSITVGSGPANPEWFDWAPLGATFAFTDGLGRDAFDNKVVRVATMPPSRPLASYTPKGYADREPTWSHDGRHLALTRSVAKWPGNMNKPAPEQAVWVIDTATNNAHKVLGSDGGITPRWGLGGDLVWARWREGGSDLWFQSDGRPQSLLQGIDLLHSYYGQWCLGGVFDWWVPGGQESDDRNTS